MASSTIEKQPIATSKSVERKESKSKPEVIIIQPVHGWSALRLGELWQYRDLLYFLVWRDLKGRYRQTAFGPLWIVAQPLFSMVLYTIIFGMIAKLPSDGRPYAIFSYSGLLPWSFLNDCLGSGLNSLLGGSALFSKVYFPRLLIPLSRLISQLIDFFISFFFLIVLMVIYNVQPTWGIVFLPVLLLLMAILGVGIGLWFSGFIVRFRDFGNIMGYFMRAWMYASPVVYASSVVPPQWQTLYHLNPMTPVIEAFRWGTLGSPAPPLWSIGLAFLIAIPIFVGGLYKFKRDERNIVDV